MSKKKINWPEQLNDCQGQLNDLENKWKRALADYANLEKRIDNEKQSFVKYSNLKLLEKLLPILDDLEAAENHLKDQGLKIILNKLKEILKSEGVEEIKTHGEEFQPEAMEVIEMVAGPKNKVMEVSNKGYLLDDRILRVAKVKVGGIQSKEN